MLGADTVGPRFNIITLRDSHLPGYRRGAGPLRHLGTVAEGVAVAGRNPFRRPVAPMGRTDVDTGAGRGILPALCPSYAGKYERMLAILVEDGQFETATKRSA
mgnify:CR=1 FL=1